MRKTVMVSFRTSQELKESLDRIVRESKGSRSSTIEIIISEFLSRNREKLGHAPNGTGPMELCVMEEEGGHSEKNAYLLLGGVRIGLPKSLQSKITVDEKTGSYQIEFAMPEEKKILSPEGPTRETTSEIELRDQTRRKGDGSHA